MNKSRGLLLKILAGFLATLIIVIGITATTVTYNSKKILKNNATITSSQTLNETLKQFQTYLKSLSIPVDLLTRKNEIKHLEDEDEKDNFDSNIKAIQDSLVASLKVTENPVRCYYSTKSGYLITAHLEEVDGKTTGIKELYENVDNTSKEWYINAIGTEKRNGVFAYISAPYKDDETGDNIITVSQEIKVNDVNLGVVAMDIAATQLEEYVTGINLLQTGYVILADNAGNILINNDKNNIVTSSLNELSFWTTAVNNDGNYSFNKNGINNNATVLSENITGWYLVGIISDNEISSNVSNITHSIFINGVISVIIGFLIAFFIAYLITKELSKVQTAIASVKNGDFSARIAVKKNDEFGTIENDFNDMVASISELISNLKNLASVLLDTSSGITDITSTAKDSMMQVTEAIHNIALGASEQASSTQNANSEVDVLSDSLTETVNYVDKLHSVSSNATELSNQGISTVEHLIGKSNLSREKSQTSMDVMSEMIKSIDKINYISDAIADITSQTNLLSLNASIEAARAGEAGKGFAVVADEIRQLAEQSKASTDEIKAIVAEITDKSHLAESSMIESEKIQNEQQTSINETKELFNNLSNLISDIINSMNELNELNSNMTKNKDSVVSQMENIASVAEESAAAAEEVNASTSEINDTMETIAKHTKKLDNIASELKVYIGQFKL